jgi:uncharacterized protein
MAEVAEKPQGVVLGAGGDPQVLGIPVFVLGSIALGFALLGFPATYGSVIPIIALGTGMFLLVSTVWSIVLGMSFVAAVFGIFSAFWLSLAGLLLGAVLHGEWFGVKAAADATSAAQAFYVTWAILIFIAFIPTLRLPVIYPLIFILIVLALVLAAASAGATITGIVVLAFAALGAYLFVSLAFASLGGRALPLGPALLR